MIRSFLIAAVLMGALLPAHFATAQESKAAQATRQKVKQVIAEFEAKEIGTKAFFEDVNRELDKPINFKIDNNSGISNNTKLTYKGKKITVEKLLNELSDKYEFGWVVISNAGNNKVDGSIVIRKVSKGKERGYEVGKEPKTEKQSSLELRREQDVAVLQPALSCLAEPGIVRRSFGGSRR